MPSAEKPFDWLLLNGHILDGTGNPWFAGDIALRGDRIAAVGKLADAQARNRLDLNGLTVAPGFIDTHVHGDLPLFLDPAHEPAIRQGVTTYIIGQDGVAMAPCDDAILRYMCRYTAGFSAGAIWLSEPDRPRWSSMAEYLTALDGTSAVNAAVLIPNGNLRLAVMGLETRPPTPDELRAMQRMVTQAMEEGAVGLSTGLDYIPSRYATTEELVELCKPMAKYGGVYVTHMRRYDPDGVLWAMDEVFRISREAGVGGHISHFNSRAEIVLPALEKARAEGVDITFDLYCYLAGSTILGMIALPPEVQEGGLDATLKRLSDPATREKLRPAFESPRFPLATIRIGYIAAEKYRHHEGKTLAEIAGSTDPQVLGDTVLTLLTASELAVGCVVPHKARGENDIRDLIRSPAMMGGSDGIFVGRYPHPRGWGCYARYLGHHVREAKTWSLETAVMRLTSHAARRYGLLDRGLLRAGMAADVVVFDPEQIADRSTFADGRQLAVGVHHVWVNGEPVLLKGERTAARPGRGLRRG
jgi:N-acyl-D-amino-acid deacylase